MTQKYEFSLITYPTNNRCTFAHTNIYSILNKRNQGFKKYCSIFFCFKSMFLRYYFLIVFIQPHLTALQLKYFFNDLFKTINF